MPIDPRRCLSPKAQTRAQVSNEPEGGEDCERFQRRTAFVQGRSGHAGIPPEEGHGYRLPHVCGQEGFAISQKCFLQKYWAIGARPTAGM